MPSPELDRPAAAGTPPHVLLALLLSQFAFGLLAMTICIPSMQEWGAQFGVAQSTVQLTFSGFVVAFGGFQLVFGPLSDRLGRRAVLLGGLALAVLATIGAAMAPTMGWLVAARVLQGAGAAAGMVVGRAMVQDEFQGAERTRVMAFVGMAMGLCPPTATVLGGQLHVHFGWQANFVLMGVLGLLLGLASWHWLPQRSVQAAAHAATQDHGLASMGRAYLRLWREPAFCMMVALLGFTTATFYCFLAGSPVVLRSYGVGPDRIGYVIMSIPLAYIVGNYLTSRLARRHGESWLLRTGQVLTLAGTGLLVLLALAGLRSVWAVVLPLVLVGLGHGFLVPPTLSASVSVVPALAGTAAAVAGLVQQTMGALGGYVVGLVPHSGALNLGWLMLGFTVLGAVAWRAMLRMNVRHAPPA
jgi:DHA1 family bicyclomycin/chloramphenicol resistance-like MFS transporter